MTDTAGGGEPAIQTVSGNMRGRDIDCLHQVPVDVWFLPPDIQHHFEIPVITEMPQQRLLIHSTTAGGIDQDGIRPYPPQKIRIDHVPGRVRPAIHQRHMQTDYIGLP